MLCVFKMMTHWVLTMESLTLIEMVCGFLISELILKLNFHISELFLLSKFFDMQFMLIEFTLCV